MAYQEGERAKKMENPTMRGPLESNAKRFAALAEKLEAARKQQANRRSLQPCGVRVAKKGPA